MICLLNEETSRRLDKFKIFKFEAENQRDLNHKILRSGPGGKY